MSKQLVKTTVCSEYQTLLEQCQKALEIWNGRRAEISQSRLVGKEAGDQLLRLQANYARAYTVLENHAHDCTVCQLVSRLERRDSEHRSDAPSESALYSLYF
jgi:hypothetical protein